VKTHDEIEAELNALGWKITAGPSRTSSGWKVTAQCGTSSVQLVGWTKLGVLEDLLRYAQQRAKRKP